MALLDRLGAAERQQPAAGDQHGVGAARFLDRLAAQFDDILLALFAGLAEAEQAEALQRQHLEAGSLEEIRQPVVDLIGIGCRHRDALGANALEPIDHRFGHGRDRQAGLLAKLLEQLLMRLIAAIERQRRADHHDRIDAFFGQLPGGRQDAVPGGVITLWRQRPHADGARNELHARIHHRAFVRHLVGRERHDQPDGELLAHGWLPPRFVTIPLIRC